jgi:hypothetical protein
LKEAYRPLLLLRKWREGPNYDSKSFNDFSSLPAMEAFAAFPDTTLIRVDIGTFHNIVGFELLTVHHFVAIHGMLMNTGLKHALLLMGLGGQGT